MGYFKKGKKKKRTQWDSSDVQSSVLTSRTLVTTGGDQVKVMMDEEGSKWALSKRK